MPPLGQIENTVVPAAGKGLTLGVNGTLPASIIGVSVLEKRGVPVDINTTASESNLYDGTTTTTTGWPIPGGTLGEDGMLALYSEGNFLFNNNAANTLRIRCKYGGTTHIDVTFTGLAIGATRIPWQFLLAVESLGAPNSQQISLRLSDMGLSGAARFNAPPTITTGIAAGFTGAATAGMVQNTGTIDSSILQTLAMTVQWSASSANNSWLRRYATLTLSI